MDIVDTSKLNDSFKDAALLNPDTANSDHLTFYRLAEKIDSYALHGYFPDPHCPYILANCFYAPFGSTVSIQGDFPHCRYFSISAILKNSGFFPPFLFIISCCQPNA
jgi:hypothetical protein